MDFKEFKGEVVSAAKAAGLTDYELYYESDDSTQVSVFGHEINQFSSGVTGGAAFRCSYNGKPGAASTEALSKESAVDLVRRAMENALSIETDDPVLLAAAGGEYQKPGREPYALPTTQKLVETALGAQEKLYKADERVVDGCSVSGITAHSEIALVNSNGVDLSSSNNLSFLIAAAVVAGEDEKTNSYRIKAGELSKIDVDELVNKAAKSAVDKLGGTVPPTTACPVVFSSDAMADLLATFNGIFSSDNAQKGLSRLKGREGEKIAGDNVTIIDDPFHPESSAPMAFDGEGSPTYKKSVVENGVLKTLLYNLRTAAKEGRATTGNAVRHGYSEPVEVGPSCMYLAPGDMSEDELIKKAGNGVYINFLGGMHAGANPVSGDFSLQSAGFLIENGVKTKPIKSFTVAGSFYGILNNIKAIGSEVEFPSPTGSRMFGAPPVLVEGLSVAGK